jgi:hypothetical protein
MAAHWLGLWRDALDEGPDRVLRILVSDAAEAAEMWQNRPFTGILPADERRTVLGSFRGHWRGRLCPMTREQLAHVLRTVVGIAGERDILVIGRQSILGSYPEDVPPPGATGSMEVAQPFRRPRGAKADVVDVDIGEFSEFHDEFGYYPRGQRYRRSLPAGWRERLVAFEEPGVEPGRGLCLEPHECILAKLVRFDEKDVRFAYALVQAGLIDLDTLESRAGTPAAHPAVIDRIRVWVRGMQVR